jgi:hypothetical protein
MLYGRDEQLLGAASMGAHGAVGSTYNFAGAWGNGVFSALESGDLSGALAAQTKIVNLVAVSVLWDKWDDRYDCGVCSCTARPSTLELTSVRRS